MKRALLTLVLALSMFVAPLTASAVPDEYDDTQSHPLRVAAYIVRPIGWLAEWIIFRPFHYIVSRAEPVTGHSRHGETVIE